MSRLARRILVVVLLLAIWPGTVATAPAVAQVVPAAQQPAVESKIDPPLQEALRAEQPAWVIILGRTQLFGPVGGLEAFQRRHARDDRRALRQYVVAALKENATAEQATILGALGREAADVSLWIVNALALELSPEEIRAASRLDEVLYIYRGGGPLPPRDEPGEPIPILPDDPPEPFSLSGKEVAWNLRHLNAPRVWQELGIVGEGTVVAVLDIGANYAHTDLRSHLWRNALEIPNNGVDDDGNGWIDDVYGYDFGSMSSDLRIAAGRARQHGTVTSGIVLGDGSSGIVTGVAPRARLMLLEFIGGLDDYNASRRSPVRAALAYQYAIENGADIISMSFSLGDIGNLRGWWRMMSDHAVAAGLFLVGGAGNAGESQPDRVQVTSPKDIPSVVAVGGIDTLGVLVPFSSKGSVEWSTVALYGDHPLPDGLVKPDLVAFPGAGYPVLGVTDDGYIDTNVEPRRGNSLSGPQVAGVAALILSEDPSLSVWRVREFLECSAHDLGPAGKDNMFGYGLVDAYAAVQMARRAERNSPAGCLLPSRVKGGG